MRKVLKSGAPLVAGALSLIGFSIANAAVVNSFGPGGWDRTDMKEGGAAELVDLTGLGGDLENNAPLGSGALRLTTGDNDGDKAEVGIGGDFGTVRDFLNGGSLSYSYFKDSTGDLNASAAAAIKLTVFDPNISPGNGTDGFAAFVYEPTWNLGAPGSSVATPTDQWLTASIDGDNGVFWHTGIYNADNQAGFGGDGFTLSDWNDFFGGDLADAVIVGISIGVGTFNNGQTAYADDVRFSNLDLSLSYDFEAMPIPVPAALPLFIAGLGAVGFISRRKKRNAAKA